MIDYQTKISPVVSSMKPSGIRKFFDIAAEMDDVLSLGVGEPDFVTPWHIREAGIYSLEKGKTWYTSNYGLLELRSEVSSYLEKSFDVSYDPASEVIITVGGSEAVDIALRTIICPGDEVLVPEPCFVCYAPLVEVAGGVAVPIPTKLQDDFKLMPADVEARITKKTKAIVISYPNNPTGALMTKEELEAVAAVIKRHDLIAISDEIYAELSFGVRHTSIASLPGMWERTILVSGFSKAFAMTGWRIGYACAPKELMACMGKIHQFAIMCASTPAQFAALEGMREGKSNVDSMAEQYNMRRQYIYKRLLELGFDSFEPKGAFYIFPSVEKFEKDDEAFCEKLLHTARVAFVPGSAFGESGTGHVRISYAYSVKQIEKALERVERFLGENY